MAADIWTFGNPTADAQWGRVGQAHTPYNLILGGWCYTSYSPVFVGVYHYWTQRRGRLQANVFCGDYCRVGG